MLRINRQYVALHIAIHVLAMVGHLKNFSPTFAQMPNRTTNFEFISVSPTTASTMLAVVAISLSYY
jgi:hypothetical protein